MVPRWIGAFDVGLIPFRQDEVCAAADTLKFYEYIALGKPVVTTCVPSATGAPAVAYCASNREEFVALVGQALQHDCDARRFERINLARQNTWSIRAATFMNALRSDVRTPSCP
jgi:hypothetical protein